MTILTVSFDMYQDPSTVQMTKVAFLILLIGVFCCFVFSVLLESNFKNKAVTCFAGLVSIAFITVGLYGLIGKSKEETYVQEYNTLKKNLFLNEVSEAKVSVKQISNHKFVIKQNGIKHITSTVSGKKVTTTPNTTTGKAYLRVVDYIKDQQKQEPTIKIKITPSLSNTTASYETSRGKFKVVCYADGQEPHKTSKTIKILKY